MESAKLLEFFVLGRYRSRRSVSSNLGVCRLWACHSWSLWCFFFVLCLPSFPQSCIIAHIVPWSRRANGRNARRCWARVMRCSIELRQWRNHLFLYTLKVKVGDSSLPIRSGTLFEVCWRQGQLAVDICAKSYVQTIHKVSTGSSCLLRLMLIRSGASDMVLNCKCRCDSEHDICCGKNNLNLRVER